MGTKADWQRTALAVTIAATAGGFATVASATNGYFSNGYGVESKGLAGAGVAIDTGVMGLAQNPALGTEVGKEAQFCLSFFAPDRGADIPNTTPPGSLVPGSYDSENSLFVIPCGGGNFELNERSTLGVLAYGNGGMNTEYSTTPFAFFPGSTTPLGVNLEQLFVAINYSIEVNDGLSLGIAPVLAAQRFSATGLGGFDNPFFSANPGSVTDNGDDWSYGGGLNLGVYYAPNDSWSIGASYRTKMKMDKFDKYSGLFENGGSFDIPATALLGVAYTPAQNSALTLTAEYQRIFYSGVDSISNTSTTLGAAQLGAPGGPGFGWNDMDVFRLAATYQTSDRLTLRGGISYASEFAPPPEALINILAPATPQWHASIGMTYAINDRWSFDGAYTHAFNNSLTGSNPAVPGSQPVTIRMFQNELALGMTYRW